jgi:hypothetical protein
MTPYIVDRFLSWLRLHTANDLNAKMEANLAPVEDHQSCFPMQSTTANRYMQRYVDSMALNIEYSKNDVTRDCLVF